MPGPQSNEPGVLTVQEVHAEFEKLLRDRRHMGLRNLIGDTLLDPRNPFQKKRRKPKRWVMMGERSRPDWSITVILYQVSYISRP